MRGLLWLILGIGMFSAISPAAAQRLQRVDAKYPVCMEYYGSRGALIECAFWSMDQCWASTDGIAALCFVNRYYIPRAPEPRWRLRPEY
jgi:hypothetical protein